MKDLVWSLPGHGAPCGRSGWHSVGHISGDRVHVHRYEDGCAIRTCPDHYHKWACAEAAAVSSRIGPNRFHQRVIVSFGDPHPPVTDEGLQHSFRLVYEVLKFCGATGGLVMFHAERIPTHNNDRTDSEDGPHFHCIVDSYIDPERVLCAYESLGVVVKGMGKASNLQAHVEYVLSHLGIPQERLPLGQTYLCGVSVNPALVGIVETRLHTIRWFGSWTRLKTTENTGRFCQICKKQIPNEHWASVRWIPYDRDPPPEEWIDGSFEEWAQVAEYAWGE